MSTSHSTEGSRGSTMLTLLILGTVLCWFIITRPEPKPQEAPSSTAHSAAPVEVLKLMYECYTPCSANIQWKFKIIWGGHPLRIIYHGGQTVDRRGEEDFKAPEGVEKGETKFVSLDPKLLNFRVQVYRIISVQEGR